MTPVADLNDLPMAEGMFAEMMVSSVASSGSNSAERITGFFESRKAGRTACLTPA